MEQQIKCPNCGVIGIAPNPNAPQGLCGECNATVTLSDNRVRTFDQYDISSQLEDLFSTVWELEQEWAFDDRITLATRQRWQR